MSAYPYTYTVYCFSTNWLVSQPHVFLNHAFQKKGSAWHRCNPCDPINLLMEGTPTISVWDGKA